MNGNKVLYQYIRKRTVLILETAGLSVLTCITYKILESLIRNKLELFLENNNIIRG